jgi:[NiFe] hydrogenase diaphorase moiety large subunit
MNEVIKKITEKYDQDPTRLIDILIDVQDDIGHIPNDSIPEIADVLGLSEVDVEQTLSFYHFFHQTPKGKYSIYLNDSAVAMMNGRTKVAEAFEKSFGVKFNGVTQDEKVGLFNTSCIGMNDQEPAAIINNVVFTNLTPFRAREIARNIKDGKPVEDMIWEGFGDGRNNTELLKTMVNNNIRKKGPILDKDYTPGNAITKVINESPVDLIEKIKDSNIRGRGGAGFPTGLKWQFCRQAEGTPKYIFCNADEGEPGTFKDRVILTERPRLLFEGMTLAAYAVGASQGILYLRYEYKYLQQYLENIIEEFREKNFLGKNIQGKEGFDFDIRIQFGAGAYVCGEESALIESAEGKRGEPRDRPPFPVEKGYLEKPTIVNNVETLCAAVKVVNRGADYWKSFGTNESTGTKLLSVSGDCRFPGVYEVQWGFTVSDILDMVGAEDPQAVQVGGPSGALIAPNEFDRLVCYSDLSTGGSLIILGKQRDLIRDIVLNFTDFFIEESCGSCVPCRSMTIMLKQKVEKILAGKGVSKDLDDIVDWSKKMKANRCGLGHTAANPILTSLQNFRYLYEGMINKVKDYESSFDLAEAIKDSTEATGRKVKIEEVI